MGDRAEIVLPKEWKRVLARSLMMIILTVGLLVLGVFVSPKGEDGSPHMLSPRLAEISSYRNSVRRWALVLQDIQHQLTAILENSSGTDLFSQYDQADRAHRRLSDLLKEVDRKGVPETMDPLHELVQSAALASLDGAEEVVGWLGEPTEKNYRAASEAVIRAQKILARLYNNPWIKIEDDVNHER